MQQVHVPGGSTASGKHPDENAGGRQRGRVRAGAVWLVAFGLWLCAIHASCLGHASMVAPASKCQVHPGRRLPAHTGAPSGLDCMRLARSIRMVHPSPAPCCTRLATACAANAAGALLMACRGLTADGTCRELFLCLVWKTQWQRSGGAVGTTGCWWAATGTCNRCHPGAPRSCVSNLEPCDPFPVFGTM